MKERKKSQLIWGCVHNAMPTPPLSHLFFGGTFERETECALLTSNKRESRWCDYFRRRRASEKKTSLNGGLFSTFNRDKDAAALWDTQKYVRSQHQPTFTSYYLTRKCQCMILSVLWSLTSVKYESMAFRIKNIERKLWIKLKILFNVH